MGFEKKFNYNLSLTRMMGCMTKTFMIDAVLEDRLMYTAHNITQISDRNLKT